jgi:hypothetical protein
MKMDYQYRHGMTPENRRLQENLGLSFKYNFYVGSGIRIWGHGMKNFSDPSCADRQKRRKKDSIYVPSLFTGNKKLAPFSPFFV